MYFGDFLGEGWQLLIVDVFLEDHDIIKIKLLFPVDFDVSEIGIINDLIEGVFGLKPVLIRLLLGIAH